MNDLVTRLRRWVNESAKVVFFGGAGVSTESGIPDFRSPGGLFAQSQDESVEEMLSIEYFLRYPARFYRYYRENLVHPNARPNAAHQKLAQWEMEGKLSAVITQNIDGLHQKAGSKRVFEVHGSLERNYCMECGRRFTLDEVPQDGDIPRCPCGAIIRPDVVLYGEMPDLSIMLGAQRMIAASDLLIVAGTSLRVYPAAGMIDSYRGDRLALINRTETARDRRANLRIYGNIGDIMRVL